MKTLVLHLYTDLVDSEIMIHCIETTGQHGLFLHVTCWTSIIYLVILRFNFVRCYDFKTCYSLSWMFNYKEVLKCITKNKKSINLK